MYVFWQRYSTRLRRKGKRARVMMCAPLNHDVLVDLPSITLASYKKPGK